MRNVVFGWVVAVASLADTLRVLADFYFISGQYEKSAAAYEESARIQETVYGDSHPAVLQTQFGRALVLRRWGKYKEGEALLLEILKVYVRSLLSAPARHRGCVRRPACLSNLGCVVCGVWWVGVEQEKECGPDAPQLTPTLHALAHLYVLWGMSDRALPIVQRYVVLTSVTQVAAH